MNNVWHNVWLKSDNKPPSPLLHALDAHNVRALHRQIYRNRHFFDRWKERLARRARERSVRGPVLIMDARTHGQLSPTRSKSSHGQGSVLQRYSVAIYFNSPLVNMGRFDTSAELSKKSA